MSDLLQKIRGIFERLSQTRDFPLAQPFESLHNWDSLRHAEFLIELQQELGVRFKAKEMALFTSLETAVAIVQRHTEGRA